MAATQSNSRRMWARFHSALFARPTDSMPYTEMTTAVTPQSQRPFFLIPTLFLLVLAAISATLLSPILVQGDEPTPANDFNVRAPDGSLLSHGIYHTTSDLLAEELAPESFSVFSDEYSLDGVEIALADAPGTPPPGPWISTQKSSGDRPIQVARFGTGDQTIVILGSVSGNDPASVRLVTDACALASQHTPPASVTLIFVQTPNPDGLHELVNTNSHGVDIDRNFPSRNFTSAPTRLTGRAPASEPETQYLIKLLDEFRPTRVIHVKSNYGASSYLQYNRIWHERTPDAKVAADVSHNVYQTSFRSGSIEEYVDGSQKTAIGTLFLATAGRRLAPQELLQLAVGGIAEPPNQPGNPPGDAVATTTAKPALGTEGLPAAIPSTIPSAMTSTIPSLLPQATNQKMPLAGSAEQSLAVGQPVPNIPNYPAAPMEKNPPGTPIEIGTKSDSKEVELLDPPPEFRSKTETPLAPANLDEGYYELPPPPASR